MRIVLLGDSHLDRVRRDLPRLAPGPADEVVNAAVGGSFAFELVEQARGVHLRPEDAVVVSVGTNDAAPWKTVPPYEFDAHLRALLDLLTEVGTARLVYVTPPGVDEARLAGAGAGDRTGAVVATYAAAGAALATQAGGRVVDALALLAPLGPRAFLDDGVHLTGAAYDLLLPAIADALR